MKLQEALNIINSRNTGFLVHFEYVYGICLGCDYFPDIDEPPIEKEEDAWELARGFADKTYGKYKNIYVVHGGTFVPVEGYNKKLIKNETKNENKQQTTN